MLIIINQRELLLSLVQERIVNTEFPYRNPRLASKSDSLEILRTDSASLRTTRWDGMLTRGTIITTLSLRLSYAIFTTKCKLRVRFVKIVLPKAAFIACQMRKVVQMGLDSPI